MEDQEDPNDHVKFVRGVINGMAFSVPLWGLIIWGGVAAYRTIKGVLGYD